MKLCLLLGAAASVALACSSAPDVACHAGADCASGICNSDGTCAPVTTPDASYDAPVGTDSGPSDGSPTIDSPTTGCQLNDGGTITASQAPLGPGLHAKFRWASNVTVSTAGQTQSDGSRVWD